jgi:hypothetical protein
VNLASNDLGAIVGWTHHPRNRDEYKFMHSDGRHEKQLPEGEEMAKAEGFIAIVNAIPDMGALAKLNTSSNSIGAEQERDLQRICAASGIELAK